VLKKSELILMLRAVLNILHEAQNEMMSAIGDERFLDREYLVKKKKELLVDVLLWMNHRAIDHASGSLRVMLRKLGYVKSANVTTRAGNQLAYCPECNDGVVKVKKTWETARCSSCGKRFKLIYGDTNKKEDRHAVEGHVLYSNRQRCP